MTAIQYNNSLLTLPWWGFSVQSTSNVIFLMLSAATLFVYNLLQ